MMEMQVFPSSGKVVFAALTPVWQEFIIWQKNLSVLVDSLLRHCNNAASFLVSSCWGAPSGAPYFCPGIRR